MSLSSKLLEIQRRRIKIFKDKDNPFLKTKYAGIASINERLLPVLNELNIVVNFYHRTDEVGNQYTILQIIDTTEKYIQDIKKILENNSTNSRFNDDFKMICLHHNGNKMIGKYITAFPKIKQKNG